MAIRTIFTMAEDCAHGVRQGWFEFVRDYGTVAERLVAHYFPTLASETGMRRRTVFARANADDNAWFRSLAFANEREFAMAFRELVLAYGRSSVRLPVLQFSADDLARAPDGLALIQRQLFWVFLKGWSVDEASAMITNAAATAKEARILADDRIHALADGDSSMAHCATTLRAMELAESARTPDCLSWKTMDNIINGQISWRDRDNAERHASGCIHCLNSFTAFQEMIWLRKEAQPLPETEIEQVVQGLRLQERKGLFSRLLAKNRAS
ncbi:MAG TPA: hypothetical protein VD837_07435 [Terriglobales bacterium]|nr:hypothetical protein [Terriglobales bacterium]